MTGSPSAVNRTARDKAAHLLEQCLDGQMSLLDALCKWPRDKTDEAIRKIRSVLEDLDIDLEGDCFEEMDDQMRCFVRRILSRCVLFLKSNQPCPLKMDQDWRCWPFHTLEAIKQVAQSLDSSMSVDQLYGHGIARSYRDEAVELLDQFLKGTISNKDLQTHWPVPKDPLERSMRDIHSYLLRSLPKGKLSEMGHSAGQARIRQVVQRCQNFLKSDHYYLPMDWRPWEKDPGWFIIIVFVMVCCACPVTGIVYKVMERVFGSDVLPGKFYLAVSMIISFSWVGCGVILLKKLSLFLQKRRLLNTLFSGPLHTWPLVQ